MQGSFAKNLDVIHTRGLYPRKFCAGLGWIPIILRIVNAWLFRLLKPKTNYRSSKAPINPVLAVFLILFPPFRSRFGMIAPHRSGSGLHYFVMNGYNTYYKLHDYRIRNPDKAKYVQ